MTKTENNARKNDRISRIIGGEAFTEFFIKHKLFFICVLLMLSYRMYNSYQAEKVLTKISDLRISNRQLKFESLSIESKLMRLSRPSIVREKIEESGLNLEEPREAPGVVYVEKIK